MPEKIIITGSRGLIGKELTSYLSNHYQVLELDYQLGQDLTDESFVKQWFAQNPAQYLVNCFALNDHVQEGEKRTTLFDISLESLTKFMSVNVIALFSVCREFARQSEAKGIVNFSSTYGVVSPIPSLYKNGEKHIGYSISKGAVLQLTRHLAVHLAPRIRVNCLVPGGVEHEQDEEFKSEYSQRVPFKRMMKVNELNGTIQFLCSDASSYMTGSVISVDGGWTAI